MAQRIFSSRYISQSNRKKFAMIYRGNRQPWKDNDRSEHITCSVGHLTVPPGGPGESGTSQSSNPSGRYLGLSGLAIGRRMGDEDVTCFTAILIFKSPTHTIKTNESPPRNHADLNIKNTL